MPIQLDSATVQDVVFYDIETPAPDALRVVSGSLLSLVPLLFIVGLPQMLVKLNAKEAEPLLRHLLEHSSEALD